MREGMIVMSFYSSSKVVKVIKARVQPREERKLQTKAVADSFIGREPECIDAWKAVYLLNLKNLGANLYTEELQFVARSVEVSIAFEEVFWSAVASAARHHFELNTKKNPKRPRRFALPPHTKLAPLAAGFASR